MSSEPKEPVSFTAELVALGHPSGLNLDNLDLFDTAVLVFAAETEQARRAAPLLRTTATLSTGAAFDDGVRMHHAVVEEMRKQRARADRALKVLRDLVSSTTCPVDASDEWRAVMELLASEGT